MRGKNTRLPRAVPSHRTSSTRPQDLDRVQSSQEVAPLASKSQTRDRGVAKALTAEEWGENDGEYLLRLLHEPYDTQLHQFADDVTLPHEGLNSADYAVLKEAMYPVEWCLRFDPSKTPWFYWLKVDQAYLHSVIFTASMLHDFMRGRALSKKTNYHICKTLNLLNQNLANPDTALTDSTLATVVTMSMMSEVFGDRASSAAHVAGLQQIVKLRGGVESLKHNLHLYVKLCRTDVGWSMITGNKPFFFRKNLPYEPAFDSILGPHFEGLKIQYGPCYIQQFVDSLDLRLSYVFQDFRDFSRLTNIIFRSGGCDPWPFQELTISIEYRLLYLDFPDDAMAESLRLSMLGCIATLFLHVLGMRLQFTYLTNKLRETLQQVELSKSSTPAAKLVFAWSLMMGSLAVFTEEDDVWLMPRLASVHEYLGRTWPEAKERLQRVVWIKNIHDSQGVKVYERLVLHAAQIPHGDRLIEI
ncbi:uncharacterized protein CTRU02_211403 [Colletotrichum truncatum]|uniref:Uncharacterized protein n=1 Tax=Colletotrichum truncatum TaxID=5467 RepID=A0ACC3YRQ0_COLTU|nr:uncharacterized protein CTRU02_02180 [Colletotrichum truncatum]KAF6799309.1 hypothetical protein CTRU02_02180 [Colletotrichum truncatum]